jgi:Tol biopolymer transport system component
MSEDGASCLNLEDHYQTSPFALKGKLVLTYVERTIDTSQGDNHELGVFDLAHPESKVHRLTNNLVNESEVEISPDGKTFLYTVRPRLDDFADNSEIWQMNIDGSDPVRLVSGRSMGVPAWSPDGKRFLFIEWGGKSKDSEFFMYDVATKAATPFLPNLINPADPEFSYDGRFITFKMPVNGDRDFQPSIYVMKVDGSDLKRLTSGYSDHDPVFSRNGKKIYFERYYGPGDWFKGARTHNAPEYHMWGIVEVDRRNKQEKVIVPHDPCGRHIFWLPTVSPDGKLLMYIHTDLQSKKEGKPSSDLWVSTIHGRNPQKVRGSDWFYFFDWTK